LINKTKLIELNFNEILKNIIPTIGTNAETARTDASIKTWSAFTTIGFTDFTINSSESVQTIAAIV
jgi:hypothetical protein